MELELADFRKEQLVQLSQVAAFTPHSAAFP
jgi:hypothetical protein